MYACLYNYLTDFQLYTLPAACATFTILQYEDSNCRLFVNVFTIEGARTSYSSLKLAAPPPPSSSSSSSSSLFYHSVQSPAVVTGVNATSSPVVAHHSHSTTDDVRCLWSSLQTTKHDERLRASVAQQVLVDPVTPTTDLLLAPDMKHIGLDDHQTADYQLACKDGIRSYVNMMTPHTVRGSAAFTNGHAVSSLTHDA